MNAFYWQLRREFWENRSLYLAPMGACAVFMLGFPFALKRLVALHPPGPTSGVATPYDVLGGLQMAVLMIVGAFYCIDALYAERRDRSTLFWKSLPVSDRTAVLAKVSIPLFILPVLIWLILLVAYAIMLLFSGFVIAGSGGSVLAFIDTVSPFQRSLLLLYHLITVHSLYVAPIYGWFFFVSAWAKRAPFVWAFVPPLAIGFLERIAFGTSYFGQLMLARVSGNGMDAVYVRGTFPMDPHTHITPIRFMTSTGLLGGLAVTAIFIASAVWLRRYRSAI